MGKITQSVIEIIGYTLSIIASAITIYQVSTKTNDSESYFIYLSIGFIFILLIFISKLIKTKWKYDQQKKVESEKMRRILSNIYSFNKTIKRSLYQFSDSEYNKDINLKNFFKEQKSVCKSAIDNLRKILVLITGENVFVHLKHYPLEENIDKNEDEKYIRTFAVCSESEKLNERHLTNLHSIHQRENTHYDLLRNNPKGILYIPCFRQFRNNESEKGAFNISSNPKIVEKYYKSMVLSSISLYDKDQNKLLSNGIIIADSPKVNAFKPEDEELISLIFQLFANGMFVYLDNGDKLQHSLKRNKLKS